MGCLFNQNKSKHFHQPRFLGIILASCPLRGADISKYEIPHYRAPAKQTHEGFCSGKADRHLDHKQRFCPIKLKVATVIIKYKTIAFVY